jgi:hypothetical protein
MSSYPYMSKIDDWWRQNVTTEEVPDRQKLRSYLLSNMRAWEIGGELPRTMPELDNWIQMAINSRIVTADNCPELVAKNPPA